MKIDDLNDPETLNTQDQGALRGGSSGINALVQVTQLKSQFANEEALHGADKQRDLVKRQRAELSRGAPAGGNGFHNLFSFFR